jgi:hypothetical protein
MPSHEECYYTMLALAARLHFWQQDLLRVGETFEKHPAGASGNVAAALRGHASPERVCKDYKGFLQADPKTWLGPGHDPMTPEGKAFHALALRLLEKVERQQAFKVNRLSKPGDFNG